MTMKFESTAERATEDLAKAGIPRNRHVLMFVLDDEDEAKLADLRAAIAEGEAGEEVDGEEAREEIRNYLAAKRRV